MRAAPGGEPLLVPGFKELYLALKAEGMVLTLNTNGTLLDEQWADFFARHKPRRVNITLYGADDAAYETLCRCPGGFGKSPCRGAPFAGAGGGREAERQRHPRKRRGDGPAVRHCPPIGRAHAHGRLHDARRCGRYGAYGTYSRYGQASLGEVGRRDKDGRIIRE